MCKGKVRWALNLGSFTQILYEHLATRHSSLGTRPFAKRGGGVWTRLHLSCPHGMQFYIATDLLIAPPTVTTHLGVTQHSRMICHI